MATKAQAFRTEQQRAAKPPRPKQPKKPRRDEVVDTSLPGVSATDRKATRGPNRNLLAGRRGGAALEDSATGTPSRKSTRKSVDRTKRTTNQQLQAVRATTSPTARATRSKAKAKVTPKAAPKKPSTRTSRR
ncbi:MAG: hypothetical protein IPL61_05520 [Myxococcales bacterium]|nr:hypothetical protein [Myxococcales bacterium]